TTNSLPGLRIAWPSLTNYIYLVQRSSDLGSGFNLITNGINGLSGTTIFQDTSATNAGPYFYRVGVQ
ncbi:MAG TPA: hypothetical protein VF607_09710, partial [Verrucomicrobiae bacterium]